MHRDYKSDIYKYKERQTDRQRRKLNIFCIKNGEGKRLNVAPLSGWVNLTCHNTIKALEYFTGRERGRERERERERERGGNKIPSSKVYLDAKRSIWKFFIAQSFGSRIWLFEQIKAIKKLVLLMRAFRSSQHWNNNWNCLKSGICA